LIEESTKHSDDSYLDVAADARPKGTELPAHDI
jgi:hypothetical protein